MTFRQLRLTVPLVRQFAGQANSPHEAMRLRVQAVASSFHVSLPESNMRPSDGILQNNSTTIAGEARSRSPASDSAAQLFPAHPRPSFSESEDVGYYGPASSAAAVSTFNPVVGFEEAHHVANSDLRALSALSAGPGGTSGHEDSAHAG